MAHDVHVGVASTQFGVYDDEVDGPISQPAAYHQQE